MAIAAAVLSSRLAPLSLGSLEQCVCSIASGNGWRCSSDATNTLFYYYYYYYHYYYYDHCFVVVVVVVVVAVVVVVVVAVVVVVVVEQCVCSIASGNGWRCGTHFRRIGCRNR